MLYHVKLQYGFVVDAPSREVAHATAVRTMREAPASYIAEVKPYGEPKEHPSLMKRLITGQ